MIKYVMTLINLVENTSLSVAAEPITCTGRFSETIVECARVNLSCVKNKMK